MDYCFLDPIGRLSGNLPPTPVSDYIMVRESEWLGLDMHGFTFDDWIALDAVQFGPFVDTACLLFAIFIRCGEMTIACAKTERNSVQRQRFQMEKKFITRYCKPLFTWIRSPVISRIAAGIGISETKGLKQAFQFKCLGRKACFRHT